MKTGSLDRAFALILLGVGVYVTITAYGYGLYRNNVPGPGFFPIIAGALMTVLSGAILVRDFSSRERLTGTISWSVIGAVLAISLMIFAFITTAPYLGMAISSFVVMVVVGYLSEEEGKRGGLFPVKLVGASLATVIGCHLLIGGLINVPLLKGPLGF